MRIGIVNLEPAKSNPRGGENYRRLIRRQVWLILPKNQTRMYTNSMPTPPLYPRFGFFNFAMAEGRTLRIENFRLFSFTYLSWVFVYAV